MLTDKERKDLGAEIWLARDRNRYSREKVYELTGYAINKNDLSYYERGRAWSKNPQKLQALCDALGLDFDRFKVILETHVERGQFTVFKPHNITPRPEAQLLLGILNHDAKLVGIEINRFRVLKGLSFYDIENLSGDAVMSDELRRYEKGQHFPPIYKLVAILNALEIKL